MSKAGGSARETAETFAARVLAWLAEDGRNLSGFLAWSGENPASLRARLDDPGLFLALLDYLMSDEALLIEACAALGVSPETPGRLRGALPGGEEYHWT